MTGRKQQNAKRYISGQNYVSHLPLDEARSSQDLRVPEACMCMDPQSAGSQK